METDRPKDALTQFKEVVDFYKKQGRNDELPQAYFGMALGLALNGHYKESIRYHKKAMRVHKKYRQEEPLEIEMNLGLTYSLAGKTKKAKKILGQVNLNSWTSCDNYDSVIAKHFFVSDETNRPW